MNRLTYWIMAESQYRLHSPFIFEMYREVLFAELDGEVRPLSDALKRKVRETVSQLNEKGFRVLGIAQKNNPSPVGAFSAADECEMSFMGYLAFLDPPKPSTAAAIRALKEHGVTTKILTGDNEKVTRTVCSQVGLEVKNMLLGSEVDAMDDDELAVAASACDVFAKLTPDQKARIVSVLRKYGATVGFLGDGINDAPVLRRADVGVAMGALGADAALEAADIVLMNDDISLITEAIRLSKNTMTKIKQNLFWAFAYNMVLVPVAAGVLYPLFSIIFKPEWAGLAMALSSVTAISLSLLLKSYIPPIKRKV